MLLASLPRKNLEFHLIRLTAYSNTYPSFTMHFLPQSWNRLFLQEALLPLSEGWYLEYKICVLEIKEEHDVKMKTTIHKPRKEAWNK